MVCKGFRECHTEKVRINGCIECLTMTNESNPTVKEKGISYTISNNHAQTLLKYKVDGALINGVDERQCDYLMMFPNCMKAFFIELKNQNWKKAVEQLENSVRLLHPEMKTYTPHLRAVVGRSVPNTTYNPLMKLRKDIASRYKGSSLEVKSRFHDEIL